jgi:hypothetical protein
MVGRLLDEVDENWPLPASGMLTHILADKGILAVCLLLMR